MNAQVFVSGLIEVVEKGAVRAVTKDLERPSGRSPPAELVNLSHWFITLAEDEQRRVISVMESVARQTLYNVCLVLDGRLSLEPEADKGTLRLTYSKGGAETEIARTDESDLSDEYKACRFDARIEPT